MPQLREHLSSGGWDESIPGPRYVHQLIPVVIPNDQGVDSVGSREVSSDDKLLAEIHAMLDPRAASVPGFVDAVPALPDDAFQVLLAHRGQQLPRPSLDVVRNPDPLVTDRHEGLQQRA